MIVPRSPDVLSSTVDAQLPVLLDDDDFDNNRFVQCR